MLQVPVPIYSATPSIFLREVWPTLVNDLDYLGMAESSVRRDEESRKHLASFKADSGSGASHYVADLVALVSLRLASPTRGEGLNPEVNDLLVFEFERQSLHAANLNSSRQSDTIVNEICFANPGGMALPICFVMSSAVPSNP